MTLTAAQAKQYLTETREYAAIASNSANVAIRAADGATALAEAKAVTALTGRIATMQVVAADPDAHPSWDPLSNTLTIPRGAPSDVTAKQMGEVAGRVAALEAAPPAPYPLASPPHGDGMWFVVDANHYVSEVIGRGGEQILPPPGGGGEYPEELPTPTEFGEVYFDWNDPTRIPAVDPAGYVGGLLGTVPLFDTSAGALDNGIGPRGDMWFHPSGRLLPAWPDNSKISLWGDSWAERSGPYLTEIAPALGIGTVIRGGDSGTRWQQAFAKLGSIPWIVSFPGNSIPAAMDPVTVSVQNAGPGFHLAEPFAGVIAGVHGTVSTDTSGIYFTRSGMGEAVTLAGPTPFLPDVGLASRAAPIIIWIGTNNIRLGDSGTELANAVDTTVAWLAPIVKRVLIVGLAHPHDTPATGSSVRNNLDIFNARMAETYGRQFVDVIGWMRSDAYSQLGLTLANDDAAQLALGNIPQALAVTSDTFHFTDVAYRALFVNNIKQRLIDLWDYGV